MVADEPPGCKRDTPGEKTGPDICTVVEARRWWPILGEWPEEGVGDAAGFAEEGVGDEVGAGAETQEGKDAATFIGGDEYDADEGGDEAAAEGVDAKPRERDVDEGGNVRSIHHERDFRDIGNKRPGHRNGHVLRREPFVVEGQEGGEGVCDEGVGEEIRHARRPPRLP